MPDAQRAEIAKLESLHADHPEGRIFTHLAEAYRKAGELERAREVLAEGIERHPDYSSAHVVLARVLVDQGESAEAEAEFRRVLQLDSHNLVALRSLGDLALAAGRTDQALDLYRRLLEIEPSDEDVRVAIREIEEGPAAPVGTPESPDEGEDGEEDSPWASDIEDAGAVPGEEEAWTVDGTGDEEDSSTEVAWSPGEDHGDPEPPRMEDAVVEEAALDDVGVADAEVLDDHADALSEPAAADDLGPGPDVGEPGMLTETIAQVYARQGLYDRAAEVYRQLLRVRPDDDGLRTRMEEMEALAAAPGEPAEPTDEPGLASEPEMEPPVGLPPLEPESPDPDVERLPGLETTEPEVVPHVAPLGGLETDEIDPDTGLRTDEPSWQDWSEPSAPEADMVPSRDYAAEDYEPQDHEPQDPESQDHEPQDHEPQDHEPQDHEPESVESVWTGAGGASGAEESPYAWAETDAEPEEDSSEPIDRYLRSLLGWAGGEGSGAAAADVEAETEDTTEPADTAPPADTADTDNPPTEGAADRGDAGESPDDDDLDTFRSWLESLKQ